MKKKMFLISLIFNVSFLIFGGYLFHKKGGIDYLKRKFKLENETPKNGGYGVYYKTKKSIFEIMPNNTKEIIFLGNSITDYCDWYELFGKTNIKNRGIRGDIINRVIDRLDEVVESKPQKIFLMIGTNDLRRGNNVDEILSDYERLVNIILEKTPETELYLQSLLPTKDDPNRKNSDIIEINRRILQIARRYSLIYINLFDLLKTDDNELNMDFSYDGLHINGKGYLIWKKAIIEYVNK